MNIPRTNSFQSRLRYLLFFSFIRTQCTPSAIHYCSLSRSLRHSVAIYFPLTATTASNAPSSLARCWLSQVPKESCKWLNFQQKLFPSSKKKMEWNNEKNREHMCSSNMRWRAAPIAILISLPAWLAGWLATMRCDDVPRCCSPRCDGTSWRYLPRTHDILCSEFFIFIFVHRC